MPTPSRQFHKTVIVTGATATGKTRMAVALVHRFTGEIISADSRQVYRGMDIGTGKDLDEYVIDGKAIPYHLIDCREPGDEFNLCLFVKEAWKAYDDILARGALPVICGGSPLYIKALLDGYNMEGGEPDPAFRQAAESLSMEELTDMLRKEASDELFARTDFTQKRRVIRAIEIARTGTAANTGRRLENPLILSPLFPRSVIHERIRKRLDERLANGMVEEVAALHDRLGLPWEKLDWFGLEYRYVSKYLSGAITYDEMHDTLLAHIRQFCKRQEIWFRRMEREGKVIHHIPEGNLDEAFAITKRYLDESAK